MRGAGPAILLTCGAAVLFAVLPAHADRKADIRACIVPANPKAKVAACTRLIQTAGFDARNQAIAYLNRGNGYRIMRRHKEAIADYTEAIERNPRFARAYNMRAVVYSVQRDYSLAIADFRKAIELEPRYYSAYTNRGVTYYDMKRYRQAIGDFTSAIVIERRYWPAYWYRGQAHERLGRSGRAIRDYQSVLAVNPRHRGARQRLAALGGRPAQ